MNVRLHGDWENWIKFFLKGVAFTADEATNSAMKILALKDHYSSDLGAVSGNNSNYQRLLDHLFEAPVIDRKDVSDLLGVSSPTSGSLIDAFVEHGILKDVTPERQRNKRYKFEEYIAIMDVGT